MLSLNATFENSLGGRHSFKIKDPDRNKPAEEIRASLQKLVDLNLFEKGEVGLFKKLLSAKFVETIETPIFDLRNEEEVEPAAPAVEVQPETVQAIEAQAAPTIEVQPESVQIQEAPAAVNIPQPGLIASQSAAALMQAAPAQPASTMDKPRSLGGTQCIRVTVPQDYQPNKMSDDELIALLSTGLPEGAKLEDFSLEDIVITMEEPGEEGTAPITPVMEQMTSPPLSQSIEVLDESAEEPADEKYTGWFPKRKKGTNPLAGFSADKRRNKKAINRWKREKNKDKKK
ncbi:DUF2922 domain-containing protein [Enterococcus sp. 669A]|uniref:DUF2922 domain-containing protein n=1 Tax=Candidatus Enterococcus moelleringii TaxID=2815325 RepID=A0ABS3LIA8_9ENTE|nr:DUF2922 domain-containing protein [Enterococcus sp. 669A]MBO1308446.1 DUF2922 domain-containing protein [Enterococcus sp. 669A]